MTGFILPIIDDPKTNSGLASNTMTTGQGPSYILPMMDTPEETKLYNTTKGLEQGTAKPAAETAKQYHNSSVLESPYLLPNTPDVDKAAKVAEILDKTKDSPDLQDFLMDPDFVSMAQDDIDNLVELENAGKDMRNKALEEVDDAWNYVVKAVDEMGRAFQSGRTTYQFGQAGFEYMKDPSKENKAKVDALAKRLGTLDYDYDGFLGFLTSASEIVGQNLETFAQPEAAQRLAMGGALGAGAGFAGGPLSPVTVPAGTGAGLTAGALTNVIVESFETEAGSFYVEAIDQGIDKDVAGPIALTVGVINSSLEVAGTLGVSTPVAKAIKAKLRPAMITAMKNPTFIKSLGNFMKHYSTAVLLETGTEVIQEIVNIVGEEIGKEFSKKEGDVPEPPPESKEEREKKRADLRATIMGQIMAAGKDQTEAGKMADIAMEASDKENPPKPTIEERLEKVFIKTLKGMAVLALPGAAINLRQERRAVKAAKEQLGSADAFAQALQKSKLLNRSKQDLAFFGEQVIGQRHAYMSAKTLDEVALAHKLDLTKIINTPSLARQYEESLETGADIPLPMSTYISEFMSNTEAYKAIREHVRYNLDGYSAAEAQELEGQILDSAFDSAFAEFQTEETTNTTQDDPDTADQDAAEEEGGAAPTAEGDAFTPTPIEDDPTSQGDQFDLTKIAEDLDNEIAAITQDTEVLIGETNETLEKFYADNPDFPRPEATDKESLEADTARYELQGLGDQARGVGAQATDDTKFLRHSDEDLAQIEASMGLDALFKTADEAGIGPAEYTKYLENLEKAQKKREKEKVKQHLSRQRKQVTGEIEDLMVKLHKRAVKEVEDSVVEQIRSKSHGNEEGAMPIDYDDLIDAIDNAGYAKSDEDITKVITMIRRNGANVPLKSDLKTQGHSLAEFAAMHGLEDERDVVNLLVEAPKKKDAIKDMTDRMARQERPDLFGRQAELTDSIRALLEDDTQTLIRQEIAILSGQRAEKKLHPKNIRRVAKQRIQQHFVNDVSAYQYLAAAKRQGKAAGLAVRQGDRDKAYQHKVNQLLLLQFVREAKAAAEQTQKNLKDIRAMRKRIDKKRPLGKGFGEVIDEGLATVAIGPRPGPAKQESLREKADKMKEKGLKLPWKLRQLEGRHYRDMTLEELDLFTKFMKETYAKGRKAWENEQEDAKTLNNQRVNDVIEATENLDIREEKAGVQNRADRIRATLRETGLLIQDWTTVIKSLDTEDQGKVYQALFDPIDKAVNHGYGLETNMGLRRRERANATRMKALLNVFTNEERHTMGKKNILMPRFRKSISRDEQLSILLHMGNATSKQALIDSRQYTDAQLTSVLENATERDLKFAQSIWDELDSMWPEISKATQQRRGFTPTKVQAVPLETQFGTFRGGYYPIRRTTKIALADSMVDFENAVDDLRFGKATSSHTNHGHTEDRVSSSRPVVMSLFTISGHMKEVAYDLEMGDAANEVYNVLHDPGVKAAFASKGQTAMWDTLDLRLADAITGQVRKGDIGSRLLRFLRNSLVFNAIGWSFSTASSQWLGLTHTVALVGHANTVKALGTYIKNKKNGFRTFENNLRALSPVYDSRTEAFNKDIEDLMHSLTESKIASMTPEVMRNLLQRSFFFMIKTAQQMVDGITFVAGYNKALQEGLEGQAAIDRAEYILVRSQGSPDIHQRTPLEAGSTSMDTRQQEWIRAFTPLMNIFIRKLNIAIEKGKSTDFTKGKDIASFMSTLTILYMWEALLGYYIMSDNDPEDDDAEELTKEVFSLVTAGVPGVREIGSVIKGHRGGGSVGSFLGDVGKAAVQVGQGELDSAAMRSLFSLGAKFAHVVPERQVLKTWNALEKAAEGHDVDFLEYFHGPKWWKYN